MAENSTVEIEEIIGDLDYSTPFGSRSSSLDRGSYLQSSFQDPTSNPERLEMMEAVDCPSYPAVRVRPEFHN